jgi:predicted hydrocarbon binding protein
MEERIEFGATTIQALLGSCRGIERVCAPLFEIVGDHESDAPSAEQVLEACAWIETHLGAATLRAAGQEIGRSIFARAVRAGVVPDEASPDEAFEAIARAPLPGYELEIRERGPLQVTIARRSALPCALQEGIFLAIAEAAGGLLVRVEQPACGTGRADCVFEVRWMRRRG